MSELVGRNEMRQAVQEKRRAARKACEVMVSCDNTVVSEASTVVKVIERPMTAGSLIDSKPGSVAGDLSSTARTAAWISANPDVQSSLTSSLGNSDPLKESSSPNRAHPKYYSPERSQSVPRPVSSLGAAAAYLGKMAGLLFRRDQKVKPMSPTVKGVLAKLASADSAEGSSVFGPSSIPEGAHESIDGDAFGSDDELWRKDEEENQGKEASDEGSFHSSELPNLCTSLAEQCDYSHMLEQMAAVLDAPPVAVDSEGNTVADDDFEEDPTEEERGEVIELASIAEGSTAEGSVADELIDCVIDFKIIQRGNDEELPPLPKSAEGARLNLNAFIEESLLSDDKAKTKSSQILRLNAYLLRKLGRRRFGEAYKFLKQSENLSIDEDALLFELERILKVGGLKYLDELFTLLALEQKDDDHEADLVAVDA